MPSRVSFSTVATNGTNTVTPMDIENSEQEGDIILAAQLSRIICRALETQAFDALQKALNKSTTFDSPEDAKQLLFELGCNLLQCRWRIAWWERSGDGGPYDTISKQRYIKRLQELTKVLYFYFCSAKCKLPSWLTDTSGLQGIYSSYAGTNASFFDDFPHANSITAYEEWMNHGRRLVCLAETEKRFAELNLYPEPIVQAVV